MITIDERLSAVIESARRSASHSQAWSNAIDRAARELETNPYIHYNGRELVILSSTSDNIYAANGSCQCKAYANRRPCWHRAAARLIERYNGK
jgi:hypothetical protein